MTSFRNTLRRVSLCAALLPALAACGGSAEEPRVETAQFIAMAKAAACTESRNRLYVIDDMNVFWDTAGDCPYASPVSKLFAKTPGDLLCTYTGRPGGAFTVCNDNALREMFSSLVANRDKAGLGLGTGHTVQEIPF
ncbi:MAG TPA: hypothetical protein VEC01_03900 [Noviherbaspirillum sp.]|uniref:hypothetical protein n=1 Tax=Noviherbaspirillum sp. TaxID=1926288 RepID=UPI002D485E02|nr:hypothetical protein [Noviherbaspirillum sp.]HYD94444.1 hypothetical protein [Noviherbaspirillum sp.]